MKNIAAIALLSTVISGCAFNENPCEDIVDISEQIQQCKQLQRQIVEAKGRPLIRSELERRYQEDCIEMRYYRDDRMDATCQNQEAVEQLKKEIIEDGKKIEPQQ